MRKELYLAKSEARHYAEQFANDLPGGLAIDEKKAVADDCTDFDYIDRDMNQAGPWSGQLSGFVVRSKTGEDLAVFAYLDGEK